MNFTAMEFVCFFPVVLALYRLLPPRWRWAELLAASYFFYGIFNSWTVPLLAGTTLITWLCAKRIEQSKRPAARKAWLLLAGAVCLGCLGLFKYGSFVAGSVSWLFTGTPVSLSLLLPVGISFYTFQTLSYVIDVYRGSFPCEHHLGYYALFISFFPQLVAGPIERPGNLLPQLHELSLPTGEDLRQGGWRLARGYFKKVVLADQLAPVVDQVYALAQPGGPAIVLATACFALQIYFDFSAYSEIAIGAARLLGVRLMENFDHPCQRRLTAGILAALAHQPHRLVYRLSLHSPWGKPLFCTAPLAESAAGLSGQRPVAWRGLAFCAVGRISRRVHGN